MKRSILVLIFAFTVSALVMPVVHAAGVYKWVDENGKVQFGDQPGNAVAEQVQIKAAPPPDPGLKKKQEQSDKLIKVQEEERKLKDEETAKAKQKEDVREKQCLHARTQLKNYERARYLYKPGAGEQDAILSDEERKLATEEATKSIDDFCD